MTAVESIWADEAREQFRRLGAFERKRARGVLLTFARHVARPDTEIERAYAPAAAVSARHPFVSSILLRVGETLTAVVEVPFYYDHASRPPIKIMEFQHNEYPHAFGRLAVPARRTVRSVGLVADAAAGLAGRRRSHLRDEWAALLAGSPEDGMPVTGRQQRALAAGFLLAAVRMRSRDIARPMWRPVDWLLGASSRTNAFITVVVGAQAIYIVGAGGLSALVTDVWEPCGVFGAALFVLARWLRRIRGIELAESEGERAD